jgi:hypothetical protein
VAPSLEMVTALRRTRWEESVRHGLDERWCVAADREANDDLARMPGCYEERQALSGCGSLLCASTPDGNRRLSHSHRFALVSSVQRQQRSVRGERRPPMHTHPVLESIISLSMPRGPRVVRTASTTTWQALMLEMSWPRPWLVSVPSRSRIMPGCYGMQGGWLKLSWGRFFALETDDASNLCSEKNGRARREEERARGQNNTRG